VYLVHQAKNLYNNPIGIMSRLRAYILAFTLVFVVVACQSESGNEAKSGSTPSDSTHVTTSGGSNDSSANASQITTIQFEKQHHDFGKVAEGEVYKYKYKFKNTGTVPLKIQSSKGSCGCTTSDWSKEPVPPGGEGYVEAQFDSKGRPGTNNKHVTVICNTNPKQHKLTFTAEVAGAGK